mgnify:FL=1
MQKFTILLLLFCNTAMAQVDSSKHITKDKGLFIGLGIGAGALALKYNDTLTNKFSTTLPNIKIGYRFNKKLAVCILLPGANYKYHNKDRGFEGFITVVQYWLKPYWWALIGSGLTFDAPAFYTVNDPKKAAFYVGFPAFTAATGYEIWHRNKFVLDLQYRFFMGKSVITTNQFREGFSNMFVIGFNWKL